MMSLLRSRRTMLILAAVVTAGLVVSMAIGLIRAAQAPAPPSPGEPPAAAPDMSPLGTEPSGVDYVDFGEQCGAHECVRVVGLDSEHLDAEEAVTEVYTTLLDRGYGRMLPPGENDPEAVDYADSVLTNGDVLIQGTTEPIAEGMTAGIVLTNASAPSPSPSP